MFREEVQHAAAFRAALRSFEQRTERASTAAGLTRQQYLLLVAVEGTPDGSGTDSVGGIATRLRIGQSSATGLVERAAAAGLVRRRRSAHDARVVQVSLTPLGTRRLEEVFERLEADREALAEAVRALGAHL